MNHRKFGSRSSRLSAAVFALAASHAALSQEQPPATAERGGYVNVLPFYLSPDANRRGTNEDGRGMAAGYGHSITERLSWELHTFADVISTEPDVVRDVYQYGAGADLNYRFRRGDGGSPFVLIGGGVIRNDLVPDSAKDTDVFSNVGLGFVTRGLGKSEIRLRGEARYVRDRFELGDEGGKNDRRIALGVQIPLGKRTVEVTREVEVVRERVVRETVPAEIVDSDRDGVPDQIDQCPGTLAGLATDNRGCAATSPQALRLEGVTFEYNSADLTPGALQTLAGVADALRGEPNLRAEIAGHTDSSGADAYNLRLSQQRADAVLVYLSSLGIERSRLVARGYGEGQPVADNGSAEGRDRNRRVEFRVLN
jgi:OOP family OmpA-OmpF porin